MKFHKIAFFWVTNFGWPDISFGIHICMDKRIDIHFLVWMFSFGKVPLYSDNAGKKLYAISNSWHTHKKSAMRAGVPGIPGVRV